MNRRPRPAVARAVVLVAISLILAATLWPTGGPEQDRTFWCLPCGDRGVGDALANVLLFLPLGAALGLAGAGIARAWGIGTALSLAVELAQLCIAGRWSTIGDVACNGLGAALGCCLIGLRREMLRPPAGRAPWLSLVAGAVAAAAFVAPAYLLSPSFVRPGRPGPWSPTVAASHGSQGGVLEARLGELRMPPFRFAESDSVRARLLRGVPLEILARAGDPRPDEVPLMTIVDGSGHDILLVGTVGDGLALEYRSPAQALALSQASFPLRDWLATTRPGDTVALAVRWTGSAFCVSLDHRTRCDLGFTAGRGWWAIHSLGRPTGLPNALASLCWVAAFLFPFGLWARLHVASLAGGLAAVGALAFAPAATGLLLPTPWWEWLGLLVGAGLGAGLRRLPDR